MKKIKKKNKPKKKWSKQIGNFLFKRAVFIASNITEIDVYFKDELIGIMALGINRKPARHYQLEIYDRFNGKLFSDVIGTVTCSGLIHGLPKSILKVDLKGNLSILSVNRKVLIEKHKPMEIELSPPFNRNYYHMPG